ncbi:chromo-domain-containing protein [Lichtheimia hyalospora FSU 10163]|nr:chromo-domain-containing protein [Lichtheimia hyalospora FSU 10163]
MTEADAKAHDDIYVVEKIVNHHKKRDQTGLRYLIRWKGYSSDNNTWEDEEDILDPELVSDYWKTRGGEQERIMQSTFGRKGSPINRIIKHRKKYGFPGFKYLVRWKGYPSKEDTWEDETIIDTMSIDHYWKTRDGKKQNNSKPTLNNRSHPTKRKMDNDETPNYQSSRRKNKSDEPLLMLDTAMKNTGKNKRHHMVLEQNPTGKRISTSSSAVSKPSSTAILRRPPTKKELASITSDLTSFDFDALILSPPPPLITQQQQQSPPSSISQQQQQSPPPSIIQQQQQPLPPLSPSPSTSHPQQVPSISISDSAQHNTHINASSSSSSSHQTPEPEAVVPPTRHSMESSAIISQQYDTIHHHASSLSSHTQSIPRSNQTTQLDPSKEQEIIFDLDFRCELSYDWENEIKHIETVVKEGNSLYAIVRWNDDVLAMYPTQLIHRRCHMKLIQFYEKILEV